MSETAMATIDTPGAAMNLVSTGTYSDQSIASTCTIYPPGYVWWPETHHHHYYAWPPATSGTGLRFVRGEKPHEVVQRAIGEIAEAARELVRSAEHLGVRVDRAALEKALVEKLRQAL